MDKINDHGRRTDGIVRGMLEHSRGSSGERRQVELLRLDKLSYDIHMVAKGMLQRGMIDVEASGSVGIGSAAHRSGQAIAAWRATGGSGTSGKGEPNLGRAVAADVDIRRATQPAWCTPHGSAAAVGSE